MLKNKLEKFVTSIPQFSDLISAEQPEIERLKIESDNMFKEFFALTATLKTLPYWEKMLGINYSGDSASERRADIEMRLSGQSIATFSELKQLIELIGGVEVLITQSDDATLITVTFVGKKGEPKYLETIKNFVSDVIPLHCRIEYVSTYMTLEHYARHRLEELGGNTLEEMSIGIEGSNR